MLPQLPTLCAGLVVQVARTLMAVGLTRGVIRVADGDLLVFSVVSIGSSLLARPAASAFRMLVLYSIVR